MNLKCTLNIFQRACDFGTVPCLQRLPSNLRNSRTVRHALRTFTSASPPLLHSTTAMILDGKTIARSIEREVLAEISALISKGRQRPPHLTVVIVGDDPASHTYVANKIRACDRTGITSDTVRLPESITEEALVRKVTLLNDDPGVDGILVQLPVPPHINERRVCNTIHPSKDVDGFHVLNMGRISGNLRSLVPATPSGIVELIRRYDIETFGKIAVVVGRSKNVGLPVAMLLHSDGAHPDCPGLDATVTICHRYTPPNLFKQITLTADILIVAVGQKGLITGDMVKEGAAVIDVGINVESEATEEGRRKIVGDVDFESVAKKASFITPVPGGVGPMTIAMLLKNTVQAYKREVDFSL